MPTHPANLHAVGLDLEMPVFLVQRHPDGYWRYRCWDTAQRNLEGRLPTRDRQIYAVGGLCAALLADMARLSLVSEGVETEL